jgi:hypothetical protein
MGRRCVLAGGFRWSCESYSREALVMNLAAQLARLTEHEGVEELAKSRTARLLKIGLPELMRLRKK